MVAAVAKIGGLEGARNTLVNFSKFVVSGTDAPYKALALGSGACSIAAIIATFAANNDLDPDSEPSAFTGFFSPLFSKATTGSFAGQFLQALFGFASPSSALAYGALTALNNDFNGKPREVGIQIAAQIRTLKEKLKVLELQLKSTFQKEEQVKIQASINSCKTSIESLLDKLKEVKAGISLGTNLTLALIGATFLRSMSVLSPQGKGNPAEPFPNKAHEIEAKENRSVGIQDWFELLVENGKKECKALWDFPSSLNPKNWTGTFFGKNKELAEALEKGYYEVKPSAPVSSSKKKISLMRENGKVDNMKTLMLTFGKSKAPYLLHGITSVARLAGLGLLSSILITKGYEFVRSQFNKTKNEKEQSKGSLDEGLFNVSDFLIKRIAVPVSGGANMLSGVSPLQAAVYGPFSNTFVFWGGSAYLASALFPSMSSMLQMSGTLGLLVGNCAAVLKVPAAKFLQAEGLESFSHRNRGLTANNIVNFSRDKTLIHQ